MELDLVRKAKEGDTASFEELIRLYENRIFHLALRMTGNHDDALDVAQDVFLKVYASLSGFKEESGFSTWIYRIATNTAIDFVRKKKKQKVVSISSCVDEYNDEIVFDIPDDSVDILAKIEEKERVKLLADIIMKLSPEDRQCIILREINGLSYDEIAVCLNISLGAVKSRIRRARERMCALVLSDRNFSACSTSKQAEGRGLR